MLGFNDPDNVPVWLLITFVVSMAVTAQIYAAVVRMRLYQLASFLSGGLGSVGIILDVSVIQLHNSGWKGANSFALGLGWFLMAVVISCWKAGWLHSGIDWFKQMLILEPEHAAATG